MTVVDVIERTLVIRILRGTYPADTNLPTVRKLAEEFDTTVPTIQRTIARLETHGLIFARQGSGLRVLDPMQHGNVNLLPHWFEAVADRPERAAMMLSQVLRIRRVIAAELIEVVPTSAAEIAERLSAAMLASTLEERRDADLRLVTEVLALANNFAVSMVFNTVRQIVMTVPGVAEAIYGDEMLYKRTLAEVVTALGTRDPSALLRAAKAYEAWDERAVQLFRAWLESQVSEPLVRVGA